MRLMFDVGKMTRRRDWVVYHTGLKLLHQSVSLEE